MSDEVTRLRAENEQLKSCLLIAHAGMDTALKMIRDNTAINVVQLGAIISVGRATSCPENFGLMAQTLAEAMSKRKRIVN